MSLSLVSRLRGWRALTIGVCFFAAAIESFDLQALAVSAGYLASDLQIDKAQLGWIFAATNLGLMVGATAGGMLADRFGTRRTFLYSVASFGALTLLVAKADGFTTLLLLRFLSGLGFGAVMPVILMLAIRSTEPSMRATVTTSIYAGMPLGGISAAWYVAALGSNVDWRTPFLVGGAAALLLLIAASVALPDDPVAPPSGEARATKAPLSRALFGDQRATGTILLWLIFLPIYFISAVFISWLPMLMLGKGVAASSAPMVLIWNGIGGIFGSIVVGRLVDRYGFAIPLLACHVALGIVLYGLAVASDPLHLAILSCISGVSVMGIVFPLYSVAAGLYPEHIRGTAVGPTIAIGRLGSVLGPLVTGLLLSSGVTPRRLLLLLMPLAVVSALALTLLTRQTPRPG